MFREWLSQELAKRNWSQRKLAREINISQSFISKVIRGDKAPSVDFCTKLAEVFGEPPEKIFRLAGILPDIPDSAIADEIAELVRTLPEDKQKEVLNFIRFIKGKT